MNGLVRLDELSRAQVETLVRRAGDLRDGAPARRFPGRSLALLFLDPSLRTQATFQRAAARLGLELVRLEGGAGNVWPLETVDGVVMDGDAVEHVREAARVLGRIVDVLAVRAFARGRTLEEDAPDPILTAFRRHAGVPVVSMESAFWHPCQALADWATLEQHEIERGARFVLVWAPHPRPLPHAVPNSALCMAAQRGMQVTLLRPSGFDLHPAVVEAADELARANGGSLEVTADRASALANARVVYAKAWASAETYRDPDAHTRAVSELGSWRIDEASMAATDDARFMHCLPVRRNVVVTDAVLDAPSSLVIDQAENRLHAQTALLESLFGETPETVPAATAAEATT